MNELTIFENQLKPYAPKFGEVLGKLMPVDRLMRTIVTSCEGNPKLLQASRQSLINAAMTFAVLGLEVDGVTGQGFLIPFKGVVQPVIGYKGYNTLGARAGLTISGAVVREGDEFEYEEEALGPRLRYRKSMNGAGRVIGAWARAVAKDRPPTVKVLTIDELLAVKARAPRGDSPPWADPEVGFPAMCEKTAKRRLARDMPLNVFQMAARMEEAHEEQAKSSWIHPDKGVIVEGEVIAPGEGRQPSSGELIAPPGIRDEARMAAERGTEAFRAFCRRLTTSQYAELKTYLQSLQPVVEAADHENREVDHSTNGTGDS